MYSIKNTCKKIYIYVSQFLSKLTIKYIGSIGIAVKTIKTPVFFLIV